MTGKSHQQRTGDGSAVSMAHRAAAAPGKATSGDSCFPPAGVMPAGVQDASTLTRATPCGRTSVSTLQSVQSASPAECSGIPASLCSTVAPSVTQVAAGTSPKGTVQQPAAFERTVSRRTATRETSSVPDNKSGSAEEDKILPATRTASEAETSAAFLATSVATTGVAREVLGASEQAAQMETTGMSSAFIRPTRRTIAELEGVNEQPAEPPRDDSPWEGEGYRDTDPFEPHGSPAASLLIFATYCVFFFITGYSTAEASLKLPVPIRRVIEQRCAGTAEGGICVFAQGMRCVSAAGLAVGCVLGGLFADYYGRKTLLCLSDIFLLLGLLLPLAKGDFSLFCASRVCFGLGLGGGLIAVSIFLAECIPASARGLGFGIGKLIVLIGHSSAVSLTSSAPHCGSLCGLGMPALVVTLHTIGLLVMAPESPRWLVSQKRSAKAVEALLCFGDHEVHAAEAVLQQEQALGLAQASQGPCRQRCTWFPKTYKKLLGVERPKLLVVITCACVAACVGGGFFDIFPTLSVTEEEWSGASGGIVKFYGMTGFYKLLVSAAVFRSSQRTLGVVLSVILADCWGRGPLLRLGTVGVSLGFSVASTGCFWQLYISSKMSPEGASPARNADDAAFDNAAQRITLVGILFARLMQNLSWSSLLPVVVAEVLPTSVRATGAGLALGLLTVLEMAVNMIVPYLSVNHAAAVTLIVYAITSYIGVALVTLGVPEGKGYRLEELAPETADGGIPGRSNPSCGGEERQLQGSQTLPEQKVSPSQSSYSLPSLAPTIVPREYSRGFSSEMQNAVEQKEEREMLGVC